MHKWIVSLTAVLAIGYGLRLARAADDKKEAGKEEKITGILIDDACAGKFTDKDDPEKAAAGHPLSCVRKCAKDGDLVLLHGKKELKLDEKGQKLGKEYIAKSDAKTKVTITGTQDGDQIKVASIEAASEEK